MSTMLAPSGGHGKRSQVPSESRGNRFTRSITSVAVCGVSVFERCDPSTQLVIDTALAEARRLGHSYLGTEHLLVALARHRGQLPDLGPALLPDAEVLERHLVATLGPVAPRDAELLRTIGVDLGEVRSAVHTTFGEAALHHLGSRRARQRWRPLRGSRRCKSILSGTMGVAPRAKQSFERARRHANRRGRQLIDPTALLLGMLDVDDAMSNRMLRELGREPDDVRRALDPTNQ
jgi:ATP-dependent Clp protease ATP-binding subunit ClpA